MTIHIIRNNLYIQIMTFLMRYFENTPKYFKTIFIKLSCKVSMKKKLQEVIKLILTINNSVQQSSFTFDCNYQ